MPGRSTPGPPTTPATPTTRTTPLPEPDVRCVLGNCPLSAAGAGDVDDGDEGWVTPRLVSLLSAASSSSSSPSPSSRSAPSAAGWARAACHAVSAASGPPIKLCSTAAPLPCAPPVPGAPAGSAAGSTRMPGSPQWCRRALTRVPVWCPALMCTAMPAGLFTTMRCSSSYTMSRGIASGSASSWGGGSSVACTRSPDLSGAEDLVVGRPLMRTSPLLIASCTRALLAVAAPAPVLPLADRAADRKASTRSLPPLAAAMSAGRTLTSTCTAPTTSAAGPADPV
mmetsp:Transcript_22291/g.56713  ORF Transcript_22291/g.56713 Transcript_22291/m.56713 type:complete len:282 (-) Transcript_22291:258-1103(-)